MITLSFDVEKFTGEKSFRKFNNTILKDLEYVNQTKQSIKRIPRTQHTTKDRSVKKTSRKYIR